MNRACKDRRGGQRSGVSRWFGLGLMVVGVILLLCSLPSWLWMSVLAILLISAGFLLWRF
ncbi:MAG TPA: hypothetical protein IAA71_08230 [Candidatus Pullichristensenella stercoripullorum]|nr:hypothetical protein [Candidatus Pullichristensenella stercoripullorum]